MIDVVLREDGDELRSGSIGGDKNVNYAALERELIRFNCGARAATRNRGDPCEQQLGVNGMKPFSRFACERGGPCEIACGGGGQGKSGRIFLVQPGR